MEDQTVLLRDEQADRFAEDFENAAVGADDGVMTGVSTGEGLPTCGMIRSPKIAFVQSCLSVAPNLGRLSLVVAVCNEVRRYWRRLDSPVFGVNAPAATVWRRLSVKAPTSPPCCRMSELYSERSMIAMLTPSATTSTI